MMSRQERKKRKRRKRERMIRTRRWTRRGKETRRRKREEEIEKRTVGNLISSLILLQHSFHFLLHDLDGLQSTKRRGQLRLSLREEKREEA